MLFIPALFALLPWHLRFRHAAAVEGLLGRVFGDALIRIGQTVAKASREEPGCISYRLYEDTELANEFVFVD